MILGQMGVQKIHAKVADRQGFRARVGGTVSGLSRWLDVMNAGRDLYTAPPTPSVLYSRTLQLLN